MAGNNIYGLYPCALNGTAFRQLGSAQINHGILRDTIIPAGAVDPAAFIVKSARPVVSVDTTDITTLLNTITSTTGLICTNPSEFYFQQREAGGTFASGSSHVVFSYVTGIAHITRIGVSGEGPAVGSFMFQATSSGGTTDPESYAASSALGANTPAFVSQFYRGAVRTGDGNAIAGVQSWEVDFGLAIETRTNSGNIYPSAAFIQVRAPSLIVNFDNAAALSYFAAASVSPGKSGGFTAYLMKGASGGTRAANGNHVSIAASSGHWVPNDQSGSGTEVSQHSMRCDATTTLTISLAATAP